MERKPDFRLDFPAPHTRPNLFYRAYTLLGELTPIHADCGRLCESACCCGGEQDGMLLFPGEAAFLEKLCALDSRADRNGFRIREEKGRQLYVCGGKCQRVFRPLACRIFPLFPALDDDGRIRVIMDPRAFRLCPMAKASARLDRRFIRTVRRVGRLLAGNPACASFLREQTAELKTLSRLIPADKGFYPVRFR